jgi:hypothetical protein
LNGGSLFTLIGWGVVFFHFIFWHSDTVIFEMRHVPHINHISKH